MPTQAQVVKTAALTSAVGAFLAAGNVSAAQEIADIAAQSDNRFGILATLALPALAWVGFNIFGPALTQLQAMQNKTRTARCDCLQLGQLTFLKKDAMDPELCLDKTALRETGLLPALWVPTYCNDLCAPDV